jgi:chromosome segregation ATPase
MATQALSIPEALSKTKLDALQVSVNEVHPDSPPHGIDRLTMQSPPPHMKPPTIIKSPDICVLPVHEPHHPRTPSPSMNKSPIICALPPHEPLRPRASSPTGSVRSSYTSTRRVSRRSAHCGWGGSRSHHSEVSKELTIQAESEFFALMELMSGITLRSTSLKEVWRKIISERESHASEMDHMYERFEEFTEIIERHEKEKHVHHGEHEERKKELIKLQLDLKIALEATAGYKKKLAGRDCELEKAHGEIAEFKDNFKYLKEEHEETKTTLEETQLKLVASEERCRHAEEEAEKHHGEIRSWKHKYTELESSRTEISTKFESTHKELLSLQHFSSSFKKEKSAWALEKEELEEEVRKCKHREKEHKRKLKEITESYEKKKFEVHELTETVSKIKHEREELHKKVKDLEVQIEESNGKCEAADHACRKWKRKWEERELEFSSVSEAFSSLTTTHSETKETLTKKTEEYRRIKFERDELEENYEAKCKEASDAHREILVLKESVRRHETTIKEKSELIHTHTERIERFERELVDSRKAYNDVRAELSSKESAYISLNLTLEALTSEHHGVREKLRECETRYESISQSMTSYHESGNEFEEEIERLHELLTEVREQKEKAIQMRLEADRQRDEFVVKYEAKCRDVERLEERYRSGGVGRSVRRWAGSTYSRSVIGEEDEASIMESST